MAEKKTKGIGVEKIGEALGEIILETEEALSADWNKGGVWMGEIMPLLQEALRKCDKHHIPLCITAVTSSNGIGSFGKEVRVASLAMLWEERLPDVICV